ncbi:MAG: hypothetical protein KF809_03425 [Chloroflexi bacterium]|nr:hypothetical protein [Chloroflexota bacterium]
MPTTLRAPAADGRVMPLSRYVREELLTQDLLVGPDSILAAHHALHEAIEDRALPLLVRRQGSQPRAKETQGGASRTLVFTDNSPAIWLHQRLLRSSREGAAPPDLLRSLRSRAVPAAHRLRPDERALAREWQLLGRCVDGANPIIWTARWKLSHILPCSPRRSRGDDPLARLATADPDEYQRIRALRNLSPFNHFLSPSPKRHVMTLDHRPPHGNDLGEDPLVIAWVVRVLREDVLAAHPEARDAFDAFIDEAGLGRARFTATADPMVVVADRSSFAAKAASAASVGRRISVPGGRPTIVEGPRDPRVYQVNQGVSNETCLGILCAPDEPKGGWRLLREMRPGDVVLHNVDAAIRMVSVVEPMDPSDERLATGSVTRPDAPAGGVPAVRRTPPDHLGLPGGEIPRLPRRDRRDGHLADDRGQAVSGLCRPGGPGHPRRSAGAARGRGTGGGSGGGRIRRLR